MDCPEFQKPAGLLFPNDLGGGVIPKALERKPTGDRIQTKPKKDPCSEMRQSSYRSESLTI